MYGAFIHRVRASRGLSQNQVADIAGLSQPSLSAYEHDRRVPTADTLNRILVACGYQLTATAGSTTIACPLPRVGWFPDEDVPGPLPGDPGDERPTVDSSTPLDERVEIITAVLEQASATSR